MIKQYSIDIRLPEKNGLIVDLDEKGLAEVLHSFGFDIVGMEWRATWVDDTEYEKGIPSSSD